MWAHWIPGYAGSIQETLPLAADWSFNGKTYVAQTFIVIPFLSYEPENTIIWIVNALRIVSFASLEPKRFSRFFICANFHSPEEQQPRKAILVNIIYARFRFFPDLLNSFRGGVGTEPNNLHSLILQIQHCLDIGIPFFVKRSDHGNFRSLDQFQSLSFSKFLIHPRSSFQGRSTGPFFSTLGQVTCMASRALYWLYHDLIPPLH